MKRFVFIMMLAAIEMQAQEVKLDEVVVSGARVVQQADRQVIYPTQQQLEHSTSAYSLLQKLSLPHIRIDEASHTITALSNSGVEVRINDLKATRDDLLSLDMQAVERIEYIDHPGVRYGEGIGYVINIIVRRPVSGYVVGGELDNTLTSVNGSESAYGKVNFGKSELAASYSLDYLHAKGYSYDEDAHYLMPDGSTTSINRHSIEDRRRQLTHALQLTYSLADTDYMFQAKFNGSRDIRPQRSRSLLSVDGIIVENNSSTRQHTPSLDLYFHRDWSQHQSLTVNTVGTYIATDATNENNEATHYLYNTRGRTYTLWTEALYENHLKPFTLSTGIQYGQRYTNNHYDGDAQAHNGMHTSSIYAFTQLSGRLFQQLSYVAGFGVSRRYFSQGHSSHDFLLMRPKLSLSYPLTHRLRLKYDAELSQHASQIALISNVSIKQNSMETLVGNPDIRPNRVISHDLRLTYTTPRLMTELQGYYRGNAHCNMEKVIPTDDGHFLNTQTNQKACNMFYLQNLNRWTIIPEKLEFTIYGGLYRFFNFGDDYTHTYTSFNGAAWLQAYLGKWTLMAYADNGWHWMEGNHRGHQGANCQVSASYTISPSLTISLYMHNPFRAHPETTAMQLMDHHIQKDVSVHNSDQGNRLILTLTWKLSHGRQYRNIQRSMNHSDTETGILK